MKHNSFKLGTLAAGALASLALGSNAHAQSADVLINKLVDKGILTPTEAKELRKEADAGFSKAYQVKSGMPDWVTSLKFNGDVRARYEGFYADNFTDRSRFRYRLRFGVTAVLKDRLEAGFRLSSSDPAAGGNFGGDPISPNTTWQDNASRKFVYLDLAYGKWTFLNNPFVVGGVTVGKMENPFVLSDMVFDLDYMPEGGALHVAFNIADKHSLKLIGAGFVLDEFGNSSRDPFIVGAQLRLDSKWSPTLATSLGVAGLDIMSKEKLGGGSGFTTNAGWNVPNQNGGNTRSGASLNLDNNYNPIVADASIIYSLQKFPLYSGPFPIKVGGEFMYNFPADRENTAYNVGITFGKAGKKGLWQIGYQWKELKSNAWWEELTDSDFGGFYGANVGNRTAGLTVPGYVAGTNIRGHIVRASFSPADAWALNVTWYRTETITEAAGAPSAHMNRLQVDALWKF